MTRRTLVIYLATILAIVAVGTGLALGIAAVAHGPTSETSARQRQAAYCRDNGWNYEPQTNTCLVVRSSP